MTNDKRKTLKTNDKRTTLSRDYLCDRCKKPAMTNEGGALRCPSCWLKEQAGKIKPIDRGGYYPVT